MAIVTVQAYECERCHYRWTPRDTPVSNNVTSQPKVCPKCKSPLWNKPRKLNIAREHWAASREPGKKPEHTMV